MHYNDTLIYILFKRSIHELNTATLHQAYLSYGDKLYMYIRLQFTSLDEEKLDKINKSARVMNYQVQTISRAIAHLTLAYTHHRKNGYGFFTLYRIITDID
jgi:hypothetical protein